MRLNHTASTYLAHGAASVLSVILGCAVVWKEARAQQPKDAPVLPSVTVTAKANRDPVEMSYRRIVRGMDLFEAQHALAPAASLRFRLLARQRGTDMQQIEMNVMGSKVDFPVTIAPDNTFTLERNQLALDEDAQVVHPGRGPHTRKKVQVALGKTTTVRFDSDFEVWAYRGIAPDSAAPGVTEFVILFGPDGVMKKSRVRPPSVR